MKNLNWAGFWVFIGYEVVIALLPIIASWLIYFVGSRIGFFQRKGFFQLLGDADLLPWALPIAALAIWHISLRGENQEILFWLGILMALFSFGGYLIASVIRYAIPEGHIFLVSTKRYIGGLSIVVATITILIGALVALSIKIQ
jgi:hypothetical protein